MCCGLQTNHNHNHQHDHHCHHHGNNNTITATTTITVTTTIKTIDMTTMTMTTTIMTTTTTISITMTTTKWTTTATSTVRPKDDEERGSRHIRCISSPRHVFFFFLSLFFYTILTILLNRHVPLPPPSQHPMTMTKRPETHLTCVGPLVCIFIYSILTKSLIFLQINCSFIQQAHKRPKQHKHCLGLYHHPPSQPVATSPLQHLTMTMEVQETKNRMEQQMERGLSPWYFFYILFYCTNKFY